MPTLKIPGRFEYLAKLRDFVAREAKAARLDEKSVYAVQLAVDEACSNIIEHGYGGEGIGDIECTCKISKGGLTVTIRDWGDSFDPNRVPVPDISKPIEDLEPRGAGLYLIRKLMDRVDFNFSRKKGNVLTLFKRR